MTMAKPESNIMPTVPKDSALLKCESCGNTQRVWLNKCKACKDPESNWYEQTIAKLEAITEIDSKTICDMADKLNSYSSRRKNDQQCITDLEQKVKKLNECIGKQEAVIHGRAFFETDTLETLARDRLDVITNLRKELNAAYIKYNSILAELSNCKSDLHISKTDMDKAEAYVALLNRVGEAMQLRLGEKELDVDYFKRCVDAVEYAHKYATEKNLENKILGLKTRIRSLMHAQDNYRKREEKTQAEMKQLHNQLQQACEFSKESVSFANVEDVQNACEKTEEMIRTLEPVVRADYTRNMYFVLDILRNVYQDLGKQDSAEVSDA